MATVRTFVSSRLGPYERGVEFGEHHAAEVARTVASYRRLFAARSAGAFDVDAWADRAWQVIGDLVPEAAEEVRGIAVGAGVPVREIAALNARTELLAIANPTGVDECSTVVSLAPDRAPVAVQTWDWYDAMSANWLHWTIPLPDGTVVETVTEYGVLGKIGVNSHGVGVLFNMLHHENDGEPRVGHPLHLLSRQVLDSATTLDEAVVLACSVSPSASSSITVVDAGPGPGRGTGDSAGGGTGGGTGRAVSVELFPEGGPGLLEPEDGLLVRTNHFVSDKGRGGCIAAGIGPGSELRRRTLLDRLAGRALASSGEVVEAMNHHAEVGGVCAHPDTAEEPVLRHATLATVAVDTAARTLQVSAGGPCASPRS